MPNQRNIKVCIQDASLPKALSDSGFTSDQAFASQMSAIRIDFTMSKVLSHSSILDNRTVHVRI
jgi:hypothetical protein